MAESEFHHGFASNKLRITKVKVSLGLTEGISTLGNTVGAVEAALPA